jgi:hypothetical protein
VCCGMMEGACVLWYDGHFRGVKMSKKITEGTSGLPQVWL